MAIFNGTLNEFEKYVGPRIRNLVQKSISAKYKKQIGACQFKGCTNLTNLEAAHIHGKDRKSLIKKALGDCLTENTITNLDIKDFESELIQLHQPVEETFLILCKGCHKEYGTYSPVSDL